MRLAKGEPMDIEDILNKIKKVNNQEALPLYGLRRNSCHYSLISYINNSLTVSQRII